MLGLSPGGIAWRIWRVDKETKASLRESGTLDLLDPSEESCLRKTLKVVVDSGLIYSAASVSVFISHILRSNVAYITSAMVSSLHGPEKQADRFSDNRLDWSHVQPDRS